MSNKKKGRFQSDWNWPNLKLGIAQQKLKVKTWLKQCRELQGYV